jgi:hypothetical protein
MFFNTSILHRCLRNRFPDSDAIADLVKLEEAQIEDADADRESRKRAASDISQLSTKSRQPSPTKVQRRSRR